MSGHHRNEKVFDPSRAANLDSPERQVRIPAAAIISAARLSPGMRVADIGSGTGYYSFALLNSNTPPASVDAVDASVEMNSFFQKKLQSHSQGNRVHIHEGSGEHLPLKDASVDLAIMGNVFHEFDDPQKALSEAFRILKRGGRILLFDWAVPSDVSKEPEAGPPYQHRRPEADVCRELLSSGFRDIEAHQGFKDTYALSGSKC
jgi:ubiquinone/menaquinone biosynthesis C-methylase UbiE